MWSIYRSVRAAHIVICHPHSTSALPLSLQWRRGFVSGAGVPETCLWFIATEKAQSSQGLTHLGQDGERWSETQSEGSVLGPLSLGASVGMASPASREVGASGASTLPPALSRVSGMDAGRAVLDLPSISVGAESGFGLRGEVADAPSLLSPTNGASVPLYHDEVGEC